MRLRYTLSSGGPCLETAKSIFLILSALFPIVNPLGGSPVFLALTRDYPAQVRRILARKVAMNSFVLLITSFLVGTHVLDFFGISIPVVQVGGGLMVIANGWALLRSKEGPDRSGQMHKNIDLEHIFKNAFYPLTLPLTVGPGSIIVAVSIFLCYGFADKLAELIGDSAMSIILRLSAFLLVCIGVQIFWNGASALLGSLK